MKITNTTTWRTDHLRAILRTAAELELDPADRKRLDVVIVYSRRGWVSGNARLGGRHLSRWAPLTVRLRVPKDKVDPRAFAWLACHEFAHSRGMVHRNMPAWYRWGGKNHPRYAFAEGLPIERPQPKAKPAKDQVLAGKLAHAQAMLKVADTRLKRAKTIQAKWKRRVAYYQKAVDQVALPEAAGRGGDQ